MNLSVVPKHEKCLDRSRSVDLWVAEKAENGCARRQWVHWMVLPWESSDFHLMTQVLKGHRHWILKTKKKIPFVWISLFTDRNRAEMKFATFEWHSPPLRHPHNNISRCIKKKPSQHLCHSEYKVKEAEKYFSQDEVEFSEGGRYGHQVQIWQKLEVDSDPVGRINDQQFTARVDF